MLWSCSNKMTTAQTWFILLLSPFMQALTEKNIGNGKLDDQVNHLPNWKQNVTTWEEPDGLKQDLPAYLTGYSYDGQPVYVLEFGKWDTVKYVDSTEENMRIYFKRIDRLLSVLATNTSRDKDAEAGSIIIFDVDGLSIRQLVSPKAVQAHIEFMRRVETVEQFISDFYFINTFYTAQTWLNIVRPVAGRLIGRATVVGTVKEKIAAIFAGLLPSSRYAPKYGGKSTFVPVTRY